MNLANAEYAAFNAGERVVEVRRWIYRCRLGDCRTEEEKEGQKLM